LTLVINAKIEKKHSNYIYGTPRNNNIFLTFLLRRKSRTFPGHSKRSSRTLYTAHALLNLLYVGYVTDRAQTLSGGGAHDQLRVQAYNGGLRAEPPEGQGVEAESFSAFAQTERLSNLS